VLCDTRLTAMGYGKRLMAALPPMRVLKTEDELLEMLRDLTRPSTTARHPA
jgi:ATP-dependent DNA helicase DinG